MGEAIATLLLDVSVWKLVNTAISHNSCGDEVGIDSVLREAEILLPYHNEKIHSLHQKSTHCKTHHSALIRGIIALYIFISNLSL